VLVGGGRVDDFAAVDSLQVDRGDPEVRVPAVEMAREGVPLVIIQRQLRARGAAA
jgi:hypothetical protein